MVEVIVKPVGYIKHTEHGTAQIPKTIRELLGTRGKKGQIPFFVDKEVAILISPDADPRDVLRGLDAIKSLIKTHIEIGVVED